MPKKVTYVKISAPSVCEAEIELTDEDIDDDTLLDVNGGDAVLLRCVDGEWERFGASMSWEPVS